MRLAVMPRAIVLAAAITLGGCGSSSDQPGSSPSSAPGASEGSVSVPAHGFLSVPLDATRSGTLTLRLTLTRNIVVAGIFPSACASGTRSGCTPLTYTETASSDSSRTLTAPGAAAGSYVVVLGNVGSGSQSVNYSLSLS